MQRIKHRFQAKEAKNLLEKQKEVFRASCLNNEDTLQQSTDPRLQEGHQFLEKLRKGEKVVIGKLDVKPLKRNKRKASKEARLLNQSTEVDEHDGLLLSSLTDADTNDDGDKSQAQLLQKKKR